MSAAVGCCCGRVFRYTERDGDDDLQAARKRRALVFGLAGLCVGITMAAVPFESSVFSIVSVATTLLSSSLLLGCVLLTRSITPATLELANYGFLVAILSGVYISARAGETGSWPFLVILLDLALVNRLPHRTTTATLVASVAWLLLLEVMSATGSWLPDTADIPHTCDCDDPPCRVTTLNSLNLLLQNLVVLLVDFYLTRGFAEDALREKARMQEAIDTAEQVAVCLVTFDLDAAGRLLHHSPQGSPPGCPAGLTETLLRLLHNLQAYRPYLPQSCLPGTSSGTSLRETAGVSQGGSGGGEVLVESQSPTEVHQGGGGGFGVSTPAELQVQTPVERVLLCTAGFRAELRPRQCSLAVLNMPHTLRRLEENPEGFASAFSLVLSKVVAHADARRGIVDLFIGDRIHASFNASRRCAQHASSAVRAVCGVVAAQPSAHPLAVNGGVATGLALCGDMGCAEMRRFSVMGRLPTVAAGLERAGRMLGLSILCSQATHTGTLLQHDTRLVPRYILLTKPGSARHGSGPSLLDADYVTAERCTSDPAEGRLVAYEVVLAPSGLCCGTPTEHTLRPEWMYEVGGKGEAWKHHDRAARGFMNGGDLGEVRQVLEAEGTAKEGAVFDTAVAAYGSQCPLEVIC